MDKTYKALNGEIRIHDDGVDIQVTSRSERLRHEDIERVAFIRATAKEDGMLDIHIKGKKGMRLRFGTEENKNFQEIRGAIAKTTTIKSFKPKKPFYKKWWFVAVVVVVVLGVAASRIGTSSPTTQDINKDEYIGKIGLEVFNALSEEGYQVSADFENEFLTMSNGNAGELFKKTSMDDIESVDAYVVSDLLQDGNKVNLAIKLEPTSASTSIQEENLSAKEPTKLDIEDACFGLFTDVVMSEYGEIPWGVGTEKGAMVDSANLGEDLKSGEVVISYVLDDAPYTGVDMVIRFTIDGERIGVSEILADEIKLDIPEFAEDDFLIWKLLDVNYKE